MLGAKWRAERKRQIADKGYTPKHDLGHAPELLRAAACYVKAADVLDDTGKLWAYAQEPPLTWPWHSQHWKPSFNSEEMRVKAGGLILAAMEEMERAHAARPR